MIDFDAGGIFLHDPEHETAQYVAGRGYALVKGLEIPLKNNAGIVGWVTATGESVITGEVKDNPYYLSLREETHSQLTVPITSDDQITGAFILENDKQDSFGGERSSMADGTGYAGRDRD